MNIFSLQQVFVKKKSKNFDFLFLVFFCLAISSVSAENSKPGDSFKDCKNCPEMVVLPAGTFIMGTPDDELGRESDEGPRHPVSIKKNFAISKFQILAGEWEAYVQESGAKIADGDTRPGRECRAGKPRYPQEAKQPAVCMSYFDVEKYVKWISKKTGKHYRMVSEAEREYAARAGTYEPFPFPFDEPGQYRITKHANTLGPEDGFPYTAPAGSFPPNAFGLYDMHGNVYEWVADCWHDNYIGAPNDGRAWMQEGKTECDSRQIRGNDWIEPPVFSRSGNRNTRAPATRGDWLGFRVAREL